MDNLIKQLPAPKAKYLIFTSAGDNANLHHWLKGECNFDLWISYYGNVKNKFINDCDYYIAKKGGKFPNFHFCYNQWHDIISQYDAVMIMDDDLIFSGSDISRLFNVQVERDLWLSQPGFDRRGKVSFHLNEVQPFSAIRYTNFVEVTCPLFTKDKLAEFMTVYDPTLIGWGVDFWFSELLSKQDNEHNKIAIIDEISCINPRDQTKTDQKREIDKLQNTETRKHVWQSIQKQYKLDTTFKKQQYQLIKLPFSIRFFCRSLKIKALKLAYSCYKTITGDNWRPS